MDFYTADPYLFLLSDHNDNISVCSKKIVTDYSFKRIDIANKLLLFTLHSQNNPSSAAFTFSCEKEKEGDSFSCVYHEFEELAFMSK